MTQAGQSYKVAIVVDEALPPGLAANTAAVLTLTLGRRIEGVLGPDLKDADGSTHTGITTVPIPILTASAATVKQIRNTAASDDNSELLVVDFTDCAQRTKTYDDYARLLEAAGDDDLGYLGVALYGPRKPVQRLTGSLPLLR
ncbi:MAG TPA: DUF2000 domain-containing protein [Actinophytocola sp.]|jgi:hypothetical protein|uniref:DUF2000 domain-containing protein n=1 Tax=Actinophytocola sp. TaxID=1872138 RepID=UPI002DFD1CBC|nr:DUF2000 domain-containing protein [Actinophytocola sp.]